MEQLLLPVEAALVQLPIPCRVLDRPQQQVLYYIEQDSLLLLKQLALQSLVMLMIPMELKLSMIIVQEVLILARELLLLMHTDPLPRARREERPADVVAELDEDEQLDESGNLISHDDTSSVMGEYLKAVYARLQSETTGSASRNALEEPWLLNKLRAEGADWWLRGACAQSVCNKLDVEYGEPVRACVLACFRACLYTCT